ncbi:MAG: hypothetical protein Q9192_009054 [Flavoplaca navasiana]
MSGSPIVFEGVEKSPTERVAFRFGPIIEVEVLRIKLKRNVLQSEQPPPAVATTPRKAVDLSGQEITDVSATASVVLDSDGCPDQLEALGRVHPVAAEVPSAPATNSEKYMYTSKGIKILAEKVDRLEEQLKESQQQTAALMVKLVGGIHSTIQTALERPRTGSVSTPAQNSGVKRKRNTDEVTPVVEKRRIDPSSRNYYGD